MKSIKNVKAIVFDFDGVIIDSMDIRDYGFRKILDKHPKDKVEELIKYHRINAGLSRFHKIKYFYNNILEKEISEDEILNYANEFSIIMKNELIKEKYLIREWVDFISKNYKKYSMHIASGSEENELRYICDKLGIGNYFESINGSPVHKNELVKNIIEKNNYDRKYTVMIGDSINDYEAANINEIRFIGYNNSNLKNIGDYYLEYVE